MPGWLRLRGMGCANYNPDTSSVTFTPGPVISNVIRLLKDLRDYMFQHLVLLAALLAMPHSLAAEESHLYPVSINGQWGYIDRHGKRVIDNRFLDAKRFSEGLALVEVAGASDDDKIFNRTYQGFIDLDGNFVIPPLPPKGVEAVDGFETYSYSDFHDGMARIHLNDASGADGFVDRTGALAIRPLFFSSNNFSEGLAYADTHVPPFLESVVGKQDTPAQAGFINKSGDFVISVPRMTFAGRFVGGLASVTIQSEDDSYSDAVMDRDGAFVIEPGTYTELIPTDIGVIVGRKDDTSVLLDSTGDVIITPGTYDAFIEPLSGTLIIGRTSTRSVLLRNTGDAVANFDSPIRVGRYSEGLATIEVDGQIGYVDERGKVTIPPQFDEAAPFFHGLAEVEQGEDHGYIDTGGLFVWKTDHWENGNQD